MVDVADLALRQEKIVKEQEARNDAMQAREDAARADFMRSASHGDVNALCLWAKQVRDYSNTKGVTDAARIPLRYRTFGEVMHDTLDLGAAPDLSEVYQLLLNVAMGLPASQDQAKALLSGMAGAYVKFEVNQ